MKIFFCKKQHGFKFIDFESHQRRANCENEISICIGLSLACIGSLHRQLAELRINNLLYYADNDSNSDYKITNIHPTVHCYMHSHLMAIS